MQLSLGFAGGKTCYPATTINKTIRPAALVKFQIDCRDFYNYFIVFRGLGVEFCGGRVGLGCGGMAGGGGGRVGLGLWGWQVAGGVVRATKTCLCTKNYAKPIKV